MQLSIGELPAPGEKVWYIIDEGTHQGPYSYTDLAQRRLGASTKIWAKGWPAALAFEVIETAYNPSTDDIPPPFPRSSLHERDEPTDDVRPKAKRSFPVRVLVALLVFGFAGAGVYWQVQAPKLKRPAGLPLPAYREIRQAFNKSKAPGPLRLLGVSADYRKVWLADRSRQNCTFDLSLSSPALDNLSGEAVSLQAEASSREHWVSFERWSYHAGQRLWPGKYQAVVNRIDCQSTLPWGAADGDGVLTFAVDVFAGSKRDLDMNLTALRRKKKKQAEKARQALVMSWRDVEEKCRTLSAIAVQIQQGFAGLLDKKTPWKPRLKMVVDRYTLRFGGFLTNFTIRNEEDFNRIGRQDVLDKVQLMERGPVINNYAKRIGFVSMELIEWLQKGVPKREDLAKRLQDTNTALEKVRSELELEASAAQAVYKTRATAE